MLKLERDNVHINGDMAGQRLLDDRPCPLPFLVLKCWMTDPPSPSPFCLRLVSVIGTKVVRGKKSRFELPSCFWLQTKEYMYSAHCTDEQSLMFVDLTAIPDVETNQCP